MLAPQNKACASIGSLGKRPLPGLGFAPYLAGHLFLPLISPGNSTARGSSPTRLCHVRGAPRGRLEGG